MSLREVSKHLERFGIDRSHVAVHNWVHKADLQPISTVSEDQLAVDEKMIRLHGQKFWLYGAVDPYTNEILHVSLYPTANKQTTRWFLTELHRRYQIDNVEFLVDDADYLGSVLAEDGCRFQIIRHGNRNAIERVFWEIERRTSISTILTYCADSVIAYIVFSGSVDHIDSSLTSREELQLITSGLSESVCLEKVCNQHKQTTR